VLTFWPWAQMNPFTHPIKALMEFSNFSTPHVNFFEGQFVLSTQIPGYYAIKWILLTIPEFVWVGGVAGLAVLLISRKKREEASILPTTLLLFSSLLPLAYCVIFKTPLYNGMRHLLFIIPSLVTLSAIGTLSSISCLSISYRRYATVALFFLCFHTLREMVLLHPHQYLYFNHLFARGIDQASSSYDTDYWKNSLKQGLQWLEKSGVAGQFNRNVRIASTASAAKFDLPSGFEYVENIWNSDYFLTTDTNRGY